MREKYRQRSRQRETDQEPWEKRILETETEKQINGVKENDIEMEKDKETERGKERP